MTVVCLFLCFSFGLTPAVQLNIPSPLLANSAAETSLPLSTSMYYLTTTSAKILHSDWLAGPVKIVGAVECFCSNIT